MTGAKEISADAAVAAVLSEIDCFFTFKESHKNGTEGFMTAVFLFAPDWLRQEFH